MKQRQFLVLALGFMVAVECPAGGVPGYPDTVQDYDFREVARLPPYCKYTQSFRDKVPGGNNPAEVDGWYEKLGPAFNGMHHYCWGLMKTYRGTFLAKEQRWKTYYLASAIDEFNYVLRDSPENFILKPEILTRKGQNLILLGRGPMGAQELERAIEAKPDYWPPYAALSDYYKSIGDVKLARETLEKGLAAAPDAKALSTRLTELRSTQSGRRKEARNLENK